jgi:hypothetical protein
VFFAKIIRIATCFKELLEMLLHYLVFTHCNIHLLIFLLDASVHRLQDLLQVSEHRLVDRDAGLRQT